MHTHEDFIMNAIKAGASGYVPKDAGRFELLQAIRALNAGDEYFTNAVSQTFVKGFLKEAQSGQTSPDKDQILTPREVEIVKFIAEGFLNKEIADKLCISIRTVDTHKNNIMQKLELKSTVDLVKYAIKNELIKL